MAKAKGIKVRMWGFPALLRLEFVTTDMTALPNLQNVAGFVPSIATHISAVTVDPSANPMAGGSVAPGFRPRKINRKRGDVSMPQARTKKAFILVEIASDMVALSPDGTKAVSDMLTAQGFTVVDKTPPAPTPAPPPSTPTDPNAVPTLTPQQLVDQALGALPDPGDEADDDSQAPT